MNKYIFIISLLIISAGDVCAAETFVFKNESKIYDVRVSVENCDVEDEKTICNSKATFSLLKKNQTRVLQTIEMPETYLSISANKQRKGDLTELYGDRHDGVYFTDYNFDGFEDLGISNGNYLPYGGISNDVFLYSKASGKFVRHAELSRLETEIMSLEVNKKLKILETQTKSGCCWHEEAKYRFVNNRLQKFYVFTEDAVGDGKWMTVTTERRVNGNWRKTSKRVLIKKYYPDSN
jgi:hypothetical protein